MSSCDVGLSLWLLLRNYEILIKSFAVALDDFVPVSGRFYVRLPLKFVVVRSTISLPKNYERSLILAVCHRC